MSKQCQYVSQKSICRFSHSVRIFILELGHIDGIHADGWNRHDRQISFKHTPHETHRDQFPTRDNRYRIFYWKSQRVPGGVLLPQAVRSRMAAQFVAARNAPGIVYLYSGMDVPCECMECYNRTTHVLSSGSSIIMPEHLVLILY